MSSTNGHPASFVRMSQVPGSGPDWAARHRKNHVLRTPFSTLHGAAGEPSRAASLPWVFLETRASRPQSASRFLLLSPVISHLNAPKSLLGKHESCAFSGAALQAATLPCGECVWKAMILLSPTQIGVPRPDHVLHD